MPITVKLHVVKNKFLLYLKQRFSIALFLSLAIYLFCFSTEHLSLHWHSIAVIGFILLCLLSLRLYDDLQQVEYDQDKPNRAYTQKEHHKSLNYYLALIIIICLGISYLLNHTSFILLISFYGFNHILYKLLIRRAPLNTLLPLVKYPLLILIIIGIYHGNLQFSLKDFAFSITIFFSFIRMESIQDETFILSEPQTRIFHAMSIILLLPFIPTISMQLTAFALLVAGLLLSSKRMFASSYILLLILLFIKLILINYVH